MAMGQRWTVQDGGRLETGTAENGGGELRGRDNLVDNTNSNLTDSEIDLTESGHSEISGERARQRWEENGPV